MIRYIFLGTGIIGSLLILGCKDEEKTFADWTTKSGKYDAQGQLQVENERALKMEGDLSRRHRFYQAIKGTYDGHIQTQEGNFNVRLILVPSLPPYPADPNRIRTVAEVEHDLTNLYFNIQVLQWNPSNPLSAVGCRVREIRPDMVTGEILIAAENCPNFYSLRLADVAQEGPSTELPNEQELSEQIAAAIIDGRVNSVSKLHGRIQPTTNATSFDFLVTRVAQ